MSAERHDEAEQLSSSAESLDGAIEQATAEHERITMRAMSELKRSNETWHQAIVLKVEEGLDDGEITKRLNLEAFCMDETSEGCQRAWKLYRDLHMRRMAVLDEYTPDKYVRDLQKLKEMAENQKPPNLSVYLSTLKELARHTFDRERSEAEVNARKAAASASMMDKARDYKGAGDDDDGED